VRNARIQVQEHDGRVIFLRKMVPGGADHSYGIEVAKMAGLPEVVVRRAREVLAHLEAHDVAEEIGVVTHAGDGAMPAVRKPVATGIGAPRPALPEVAPPDPALVRLLDTLEAVEVDRLTPIEALLKLAELKRIAEG
jgi:DNA mismatch repair protein MutS